jgi:FeS assembly protein IscX
MKWNDVYAIAAELTDRYPETDPLSIRFTDLHHWVTTLPEFDDDPQRGGEKALEAIQQAWIEEMD